MILLIDNYDSFSYNLVQLIGTVKGDIQVVRNDKITVDEIRDLAPEAIILSPGPGRPEQAGICIDVVIRLGPQIPILGVCLGHQAICRAYGALVSYAAELMHGKSSLIQTVAPSRLFHGMEQELQVGRYHSLAAVKDSIPEELKVTAITADGQIMAVEHQTYPVYGVQFHPESILTPHGGRIIRNFLNKKYQKEYKHD